MIGVAKNQDFSLLFSVTTVFLFSSSVDSIYTSAHWCYLCNLLDGHPTKPWNLALLDSDVTVPNLPDCSCELNMHIFRLFKLRADRPVDGHPTEHDCGHRTSCLVVTSSEPTEIKLCWRLTGISCYSRIRCWYLTNLYDVLWSHKSTLKDVATPHVATILFQVDK